MWRCKKINARRFFTKVHYISRSLFCTLGFFAFLTPFLANILSSAPTYADYSLTLTSSGAHSSIDVQPGASGTGTKIASDDVIVTTTCRSGYNFIINTSVPDNNLYLNGNATNNTAGSYFTPSDGINTLDNSPNTWGFFYNANTSVIPSASSVFSPIPAFGTTPATIITPLDTSSSTDIQDAFSIYYGVSVSNTIAPGSYRMVKDNYNIDGTIVYQVTMPPACSDSVIVSFNQNTDGQGSEDDPTIANFPTDSDNTIDLVNNTITLSNKYPTRTGYEFQEWNTNPDGTGDYYTPGQTIPIGAGGLSGIVTLYAIWTPNCANATVCYNGNHADAGTMNNQSINAGATANLIAPNYSRTGYGFTGWNTKADGSGTQYGPNQAFTMPSSGGVNLYAQWLTPSGTLQSWSGAASMQIGDVIALRDTRDDEVYAVAKLADNHVWFIENLRTVPKTATITTQNTNHPTQDFINNAPNSSPSTSQCSTDDTTCVDQIGYTTSNINRNLTPAYNGTNPNTSWYAYGVYYNWYTATAGNGTLDLTSSSTAGDICPAGWHIPTGNTNGEWGALAAAMPGSSGAQQSASLKVYPNNFVNAGDYNPSKGATDNRSSQGRIWSSTPVGNNNKNAYRMGYDSSKITATANSWNKWDNFAVRCMYQGGNAEYADVAVDFTNPNLTSITFESNNFGTETATPANPTVSIAINNPYTITATLTQNHQLDEWQSGINSTITDTTANPTTLTITGNTTLGATIQEVITHAVTVNLDNHINSITFASSGYPDQTVTISGSTINLIQDTMYTITASFESDYALDSWSTTSTGTIGSTTTNPTTYIVTNTTTLTATSIERNCPADKICYMANGNNVIGSMGDQPITSSDTTATLLASNFSRANYGFAGWNTSADGTGTSFGPQETITFTAGQYNTSGLKLYAHWIQSAGNLQNWTCPDNNTMPIGTVTALTDQRDNDTYAVAKLADGNCWMIENFRLDNTAEHNPDGLLAQGYGTSPIYGNFSGLANPENENFVSTYPPPANSLYSYDGSNNTINIGTDNLPNYRIPRYNNTNTPDNTSNRPQNPTSNNSTNSTTGASMYSYGNYYTWHAAIADTTAFSTNNQPIADTSICPTGWRLPKGGDKTRIENNSDNEFWNLIVVALNNNTLPANYDSSSTPNYLYTPEAGPIADILRSYPNNYLNSGYIFDNLFMGRGDYGNYWSSTVNNGANAYNFHIYTGSLYPGTNIKLKNYGFTIRCLAPKVPPTHTITISPDAHISSITFTNGTDSQTATATNPTVNLKEGIVYNITATTTTGYEFVSWSTTSNGALGSATNNPTTYSVTDIATLSASSQQIPSYTVTVTLDNNTSSVGFYNVNYGTQQITTSGSTVSLRRGVEYLITATFENGFILDTWSTTTGGTLSNTTTNPTTYTVTSDSTLSISSQKTTQSSCPTSAAISTVASGITYMQDINSQNKDSILSSLTTNTTYQIKDNRDNETYCVGKLEDGNLWLLDNLALDLTDSTVLNGMNANNTNASNTTLNYLKNGGGTTSDKYAITGVVNWSDSPTYATSNSYSDPLVNLTNKDLISTDTTTTGEYKAGGYYNYCAATAGSYCYGNGSSSGTSIGDATEDICPRGWRMPTGSSLGEYTALYNNSSYNTYAKYRSTLRLPLSGYYLNGSLYDQGTYGFFWSNTRRDNQYMFLLYINANSLGLSDVRANLRGNSVRCVVNV